MEKIEQSHLTEYLFAVCEDFLTDYKAQEKCSDNEAISVILMAISETFSAIVGSVKNV